MAKKIPYALFQQLCEVYYTVHPAAIEVVTQVLKKEYSSAAQVNPTILVYGNHPFSLTDQKNQHAELLIARLVAFDRRVVLCDAQNGGHFHPFTGMVEKSIRFSENNFGKILFLHIQAFFPARKIVTICFVEPADGSSPYVRWDPNHAMRDGAKELSIDRERLTTIQEWLDIWMPVE